MFHIHIHILKDMYMVLKLDEIKLYIACVLLYIIYMTSLDFDLQQKCLHLN